MTDYLLISPVVGVGDGERRKRHQSFGVDFGDGAVTGVGVGVAKVNGDGSVSGPKGLLNGSGVDFKDAVGLGCGVGVRLAMKSAASPLPSNCLPSIIGLALELHEIP